MLVFGWVRAYVCVSGDTVGWLSIIIYLDIIKFKTLHTVFLYSSQAYYNICI